MPSVEGDAGGEAPSPVSEPADAQQPDVAPGDAAATEASPPPPASTTVHVTARWPAAGATAVCADARLKLTFDGPVTVGGAGKIQVWKASAPDVPIDTIDVGAPYFNDTLGGRRFFTQRPVFLDGERATIALHAGVLVAAETYFVTIDAGVFLDAGGGAVGETRAPDAWRFSTRAAAAPPASSSLTVAADGTGDFCTVQGAVDAVPGGGTAPVTITLAPGLYEEIVFISGKNQLTLHGADRKTSIIAYANNDTLQQKLGTKYRALVEVENSNDLVIENLTLHNLTPEGGSQAEALRVEPGDRVILRNDDFLSLQDTLLLTGRVYVSGCTIEGNVDFIWGKGTVYVEGSEIRTVVRPGYGVQARNGADHYGYVFVDSKLTSTPGLRGHMLARIDATPLTGYPASHVAFVDCQMGAHVDPRGWLVTPTGVATTGVRFWEYHSTDETGAMLDVGARDPASRQLTDAEAALMRDKVTVLAGWNPTPGAMP
jgi:pectin methylesterase-like acyl-CoA thioesterase